MPAWAQVTCSATDRERLSQILQKAQREQWNNLPIGEVVVRVGKEFLGVTYVANTLEINGLDEQLVVNLQGQDCTTFLENTVALARAIQRQEWHVESVFAQLEGLRYRNGKRDGYASRLHYFSEWLSNNEQEKVLTVLKAESGATVYLKDLDFMSKNRDKYAQLKDDNEFAKWAAHEKSLAGTAIWHIPKQSLKGLEGQIEDGDLLALTTSLAGLDVTHVGIAVKQGGRLHLLEASTISKQVSISPQPLAEALAGRKITTGIMVARLR